MTLLTARVVDPWRLELITVHAGSHSAAERRSLVRDVEAGRLARIHPGVYVDRQAWVDLVPEDAHIVRMRALAAQRPDPVVFSHWSAAVVHGLAVLRSRLERIHVVVEHDDDRHRSGAVAHLHPVDEEEVVRIGGLWITGVARTLVDLAGAAPFEEGVMAVDSALCAGLPRLALEAAVEAAGPRRAASRIGQVVSFGHPGAESAAESRMRVTMLRLGVEVPVLQHRLELGDGSSAFLDALVRSRNVGVEVDGVAKYQSAALAPTGAADAVLREKRREDEVRVQLDGLIRIGWVQAGSTSAFGPLLARQGVRPARPKPRLVDYAAEARQAVPRSRPRYRGSQWQMGPAVLPR